MEIVTERLRLRHARLSDAPAMHAVPSSSSAMAYWSSLPHQTPEQTRKWVAAMVEAAASGPGLDFVIEFEGRAIGKAGFWRPPEIGYILNPDYWGRGLAREALEAVIRVGFEIGGIEEIVADVDPRNAASLGLLERLGFVRTGFARETWEIGGVLLDSVYLTLKRPQPVA
ncbi:MAG: GNAT family N-acetyltransferase [Caulobacter sp.]|nr:GNAT family N-acetyltransferase [Caulobacter sp.]